MPDPLLTALEIGGIFTFAVTGALVGVKNAFDVFGVTVLALITGLGGGILRDVLTGDVPPRAFEAWYPFLAASAAAIVVSLWHHRIVPRERQILVIDGLGLGMFSVTGAVVASETGLGIWAAAVMGIITGVGGGMIRDVLTGRSPVIFHGELYATAAAVGAVIASLTWHLEWPTAVYGVAAGACIVVRLLAMRFGWGVPYPRGVNRPG